MQTYQLNGHINSDNAGAVESEITAFLDAQKPEALILDAENLSYREFPSIAPEAAAFLGIDTETACRLWDETLTQYLQGSGAGNRRNIEEKAQILGCIRIIDYMSRGNHPAKGRAIDQCLHDISAVLR